MPGKATIAYGNELLDSVVYIPAVTFPTLATNASATSTLVIQGTLPGDCISWNMQAPPAHLVLDNVYVSAANTLTITWSTDVTGITGATVAVLFEVVRVDGANLGIATFPSAVV